MLTQKPAAGDAAGAAGAPADPASLVCLFEGRLRPARARRTSAS